MSDLFQIVKSLQRGLLRNVLDPEIVPVWVPTKGIPFKVVTIFPMQTKPFRHVRFAALSYPT